MFAFHDLEFQFPGLVHSLESEPVLLVLILFFEIDHISVLVLEPEPLFWDARYEYSGWRGEKMKTKLQLQ